MSNGLVVNSSVVKEHVLPRLMIAAPSGRSGKTVTTMGVMRALTSAGIDVRPFKKGPDYIDPGWHFLACGKTSRNLDSKFMSDETMRSVLGDVASDGDVAIIEAAMGFYDGSDLEGSSSSANVAKATGTPVVLVIDATRMTRTVAAIVMGCMHFDPDVRIAGVIVNHVRGKRHATRIREAVEHYCGIPVVGMIPESAELIIPDRHLGLVNGVEYDPADAFLDGVAEVIRENVDLSLLMDIARSAAPLRFVPYEYPRADLPMGESVTVAVVRDKAFNFYYEENLQALEAAGANLIFVDALSDQSLPADIDGLYIGGGFPESYSAELEANSSFRASVATAIGAGIACVAECGGLMYLTRGIIVDGVHHRMVGAFDLDVELMQERQAHGYSVVSVRTEHPWLKEGETLVGHEHHHSKVLGVCDAIPFGYELVRGKGTFGKKDGLCKNRTVASYLHVNAIASPQWAVGFVEAAAQYKAEREAERQNKIERQKKLPKKDC